MYTGHKWQEGQTNKHKGTRSCISFHYVQHAIYRCKNNLWKKLKVRESAGSNRGLWAHTHERLTSIEVCSKAQREQCPDIQSAYTSSFRRPSNEPGAAKWFSSIRWAGRDLGNYLFSVTNPQWTCRNINGGPQTIIEFVRESSLQHNCSEIPHFWW